ncbi:hypothetical protein GX408_03740, partial [bacterium]|nr:hypothetical protein [bacterium]
MIDFLSNIAITISGRWYLLIALIWLAVLVTLFIYRRTNPHVSSPLRILLMVLRGSALVALLLAVFETQVTSFRQEDVPPLIAVAIDQSASMGAVDQKGPRTEQLARALRQDLPQVWSNRMTQKYFAFDSRLRPLRLSELDSLKPNGDVTDITSSLETIHSTLREENLTAILLFTDGNYTRGGHPSRYAAESGVPIFCVGVGSTQPPPDLAITRVQANSFVFTGEATPIQVTVAGTGLPTVRATVQLMENDTIVGSTTLHAVGSPFEQVVNLSWTAGSEGRHKLRVQVSGQADELAQDNNHQTVYVDVLKSRLLITLLAGCVTPEISFFSNAVKENSRYRLQTLVQRKDGRLYDVYGQPAALDSLDHTDILVALNYPTPLTPDDLIDRVEKSWTTFSRPILFMDGAETDWKKLARWQRWLAVRTETLQTHAFSATVSLTQEGAQHPIMQIPGGRTAGASAWNLLPPIWVHHRIQDVRPGAQVLAMTAGDASRPDGQQPLIVVFSDGIVNSAALLASSLWRWALMMKGINNEDELYSVFINNLIRWLQMEKKKELVNLSLSKSSYAFGEPILLQVTAYDVRFNPVADASVSLLIEKQGTQMTLSAAPAGNGLYEATFQPESPGEYGIKAVVQKDGALLGTATSLFSVGAYSEELSVRICQRPLLQGLAEVSGGRYVSADSLYLLRGRLPAQSLTRIRSQ